MRIIGYCYEADVHCVDCAREMFGVAGRGRRTETLDEHTIPYDAEDTEGNQIHPIFSTEEIDDDECCGDCFTKIRG